MPARPACGRPCGHFLDIRNGFHSGRPQATSRALVLKVVLVGGLLLPCGHFHCKRNDSAWRTPTRPPAGWRGRHAGGPVRVFIANAMICHCGRPHCHQQACEAGLLVALWALYDKCNDFSMRMPTGAPSARWYYKLFLWVACWWPCVHFYRVRFHGGLPQGRQQALNASGRY